MSDEVAPISDVAENGESTDDSVGSLQVWDDGEQPATKPSFWVWLRDLIFRPPDVTQRLIDLNTAINERPQVAANYVLRGEVWLQVGDYQQAVDDFASALILASEQFEQEDWGLLAQAMRDQAEHGLEIARRKLGGQRGE
jgi:cytochrome c-type biogenesis protein CcmH/NrfG